MDRQRIIVGIGPAAYRRTSICGRCVGPSSIVHQCPVDGEKDSPYYQIPVSCIEDGLDLLDFRSVNDFISMVVFEPETGLNIELNTKKYPVKKERIDQILLVVLGYLKSVGVERLQR